MLELKVQDGETTVVLQFEHSLRTLSKWESKHKKAWFDTPVKSTEELVDYYQFMLLNPGIDSTVIVRLSPDQLDSLSKYINDSQTATVVPEIKGSKGGHDRLTNELVYYWMTALEINWEAQDWHFNRLMTLISLTNFKKQPEQKMDLRERYKTWREIDAANKKKFGTKG